MELGLQSPVLFARSRGLGGDSVLPVRRWALDATTPEHGVRTTPPAIEEPAPTTTTCTGSSPTRCRCGRRPTTSC